MRMCACDRENAFARLGVHVSYKDISHPRNVGASGTVGMCHWNFDFLLYEGIFLASAL